MRSRFANTPLAARSCPSSQPFPFLRAASNRSSRCVARDGLAPFPALQPLRLSPIPEELLSCISENNATWLEACMQNPLVEPDTGIEVYLLGCAHFAPLQEHAVHQLLSRLAPDSVMLELPLDVGSSSHNVFLPYPAFIQVLLDSWELLFGDADVGPEASAEGQLPLNLIQSADVQMLLQELRACRVDARVGKDMLDPFEAIGLYPGLDFVTSPYQAADTMELLGYLPGLEYATAVRDAQAIGAQVYCIDAPFKLQESWVRDMVAGFSMKEYDLIRQLGKEVAELQALLPTSFAAWDERIADEVSSFDAGSDAGNDPVKQQQQQQIRRAHIITAFKLSRAVAAALLRPSTKAAGDQKASSASTSDGRQSGDQWSASSASSSKQEKKAAAPGAAVLGSFEDALQRQARLQPLKALHFELRSLHLARQMREVCRRQKRLNAAARQSLPDYFISGKKEEKEESAGVVVAVVGRQHVSAIRRLWRDQSSALYRGDVPRTFAPSTLPESLAYPESIDRSKLDPDVEHGGSRPVGQAPTSLSPKSMPGYDSSPATPPAKSKSMPGFDSSAMRTMPGFD